VNRKRPPIPQLPTRQRARRRQNKRHGNPPPNNKKSCKARREEEELQQEVKEALEPPIAPASHDKYEGEEALCKEVGRGLDPISRQPTTRREEALPHQIVPAHHRRERRRV
jgi:hypothetical protein